MKFNVWLIISKRHYIDYLFTFQCYQKMSFLLLKIWPASPTKWHNLEKIKVFRKISSHYTFSSQMSKVQKKVQNSNFFFCQMKASKNLDWKQNPTMNWKRQKLFKMSSLLEQQFRNKWAMWAALGAGCLVGMTGKVSLHGVKSYWGDCIYFPRDQVS